MKKLFAMLLALTLLLSLVPMTAAADSWWDYQGFKPSGNGSENVIGILANGEQVEMTPEDFDRLYNEYSSYLATHKEMRKAAMHDPNKHSFNGYGSNAKYHWLECACGCKIGMEPHVDPLKAENDTCICGYQFSDNADLVVLWIDGAFPIKNFKKDVTEYEVKAHTYKDFKEVKISTFTHDSEATVEYPEDLTLKEGKNVFEIKVTSENQKVTKTYTVTVVKESK